jgi:hypothetical protein
MGIVGQFSGTYSFVYWAWIAFTVVYVVSAWIIFTKADRPGWAAIIPFYNAYMLIKVVGRPGWWLIMLFIPLINFIFWIIIMIDLANSFGKGVGFALGLILIPIVFFPILAFGSAQYIGGAGAGDSMGSGEVVERPTPPPPPPPEAPPA